MQIDRNEHKQVGEDISKYVNVIKGYREKQMINKVKFENKNKCLDQKQFSYL